MTCHFISDGMVDLPVQVLPLRIPGSAGGPSQASSYPGHGPVPASPHPSPTPESPHGSVYSSSSHTSQSSHPGRVLASPHPSNVPVSPQIHGQQAATLGNSSHLRASRSEPQSTFQVSMFTGYKPHLLYY